MSYGSRFPQNSDIPKFHNSWNILLTPEFSNYTFADLNPQLFGDLDVYINHDKRVLHKLTLCEVAKAEWAAIEHVLRMALTRTLGG